MNSNAWSSKEFFHAFSGPGTSKPSSCNNYLNDCSSLPDSQLIFGSQICLDNSQSFSASLDLSAHSRYFKTSQQNSEDSEPRIFTKYHTKSQLFGGGTKDGNLLLPHLPIGKSKGVLEQFEEDKKRAQDKEDSETINSFISCYRESMHRLQTSVEKLEEELISRSQSILDSLEAVVKTLQESTQAHCNLLLDALQNKREVEQRALEMGRQLEIRESEFLDVKSSLKHLEALVVKQSKQQQRLCDWLEQLHFHSVSAEMQSLDGEAQLPPHENDGEAESPFHVNDGGAQTFPGLLKSSGVIRKGKKSVSEKGEAALLLPPPNPRASLHHCDKCSAEGLEAESGTHRHKRRTAILGLREGKDVQPGLEPRPLAKRSSENRDSSSKMHGDHCKRELSAQETSHFSSVTLKDLITKAKPKPTSVLQDCQPTAIFCRSTRDQNKELEQKGKSMDIRKKGKRKTPRKVQRGTFIRRKSSSLSRNSFPFRSRIGGPQPAASGQAENPRQPLPLLCSYKTLPPVGKGRRETEGADHSPTAASSFFLYDCSSQETSPFLHSTEGDKRMRWFSDLHSDNSESPSAMETEANTFYAVAFDSSDDDGH